MDYLLTSYGYPIFLNDWGYRCRCEAVRHCRWVDEVVSDAPWIIDGDFMEKYQIDYVAHDEDPYVSGNHDDVYGYVKSIGTSVAVSSSALTNPNPY